MLRYVVGSGQEKLMKSQHRASSRSSALMIGDGCIGATVAAAALAKGGRSKEVSKTTTTMRERSVELWSV